MLIGVGTIFEEKAIAESCDLNHNRDQPVISQIDTRFEGCQLVRSKGFNNPVSAVLIKFNLIQDFGKKTNQKTCQDQSSPGCFSSRPVRVLSKQLHLQDDHQLFPTPCSPLSARDVCGRHAVRTSSTRTDIRAENGGNLRMQYLSNKAECSSSPFLFRWDSYYNQDKHEQERSLFCSSIPLLLNKPCSCNTA